jgi:hypothetical protein
MSHRLQPVVGNWYAHRDKGDVFQVVAYDEDEGTIEIQEFDGGLDEVDVDTWNAMPLEAATQPEDWSGTVDDVEPDEFGYTDYEAAPQPSEPGGATTWEVIVEDDDEEMTLTETRRTLHYNDGRSRTDH